MILDWQYSRSWRKHYVDDGKFYEEKLRATISHWRYLYEIVDLTPYGFTHQLNKEGYDLYHKKIGHGKTVKELKMQAEIKEK
jgi:hypothetical protein